MLTSKENRRRFRKMVLAVFGDTVKSYNFKEMYVPSAENPQKWETLWDARTRDIVAFMVGNRCDLFNHIRSIADIRKAYYTLQ